MASVSPGVVGDYSFYQEIFGVALRSLKTERRRAETLCRPPREGRFYGDVPSGPGSLLSDSGAGSLPVPSRRPLRGSGRRGLAGDPRQRPEMRRRDSPQRPVGLGAQGARWPMRVLTARCLHLAWSSQGPAPPGWGWSRRSPRLVEELSPSPLSPTPNSPAFSGRRRPAHGVCAGSAR